jgi:hypothetical protein
MLAAHEEEFVSAGMYDFPDDFTFEPLQRFNGVVHAVMLVATFDHQEIILVIRHIDRRKISGNLGL